MAEDTNTEQNKTADTPKAPTPSAAPAPAKKSNKTLVIVIVAVVVVFVVLPLTALTVGGFLLKNKFGSQKAIDNTVSDIVSKATGSDVDVDSSKGSVNIKGDNGSSLSYGSNQNLPSDFPKSDVPYLPEKEVTFQLTSTSDGKKSWSVTTTVNESFAEASSYFEGKVKEPDYTDVTTYGASTVKYYSGKNSKYSVFITVSEGSNGDPTGVSYVISEE
ncbi:hypothetical protein KC930_00590 [Candidatus Saccharibacteria bacterium]|nr:hypothetical protein [Candidatus Saccharibacteria bacterium]